MEEVKVDLEVLFQRQIELQEKLYNVKLPSNVDALLGRYALGMFTEIGEAMAINKKWKDWRKTDEYDRQAFEEEIADIMIYLINFALASGVGCNDFLRIVDQKQKVILSRDMRGSNAYNC